MKKALGVILTTVALDAVGVGLVLPIIPRLLREVDHTSDIGWRFGAFLALYALMQFVCAPILGAFSDRFGRRPVLLVSLAGAAIAGARKLYATTERNAPLRANATLEAVGGTAVYLASDLGACTTGQVIFVDGGFHVTGTAQPENL